MLQFLFIDGVLNEYACVRGDRQFFKAATLYLFRMLKEVQIALHFFRFFDDAVKDRLVTRLAHSTKQRLTLLLS